MNRRVILLLGFLLASACAHNGVTAREVLNTRLGDVHNLKVMGCYRDDAGALRALYLKENAPVAGCFAVDFDHEGEIVELHATPCGVLDDTLMNSDCALEQ